MNLSNNRLPGGLATQSLWTWVALIVVVLMLTACSGGSSTSSNPDPGPTAQSCDPSDPATADQCGTLILGLTDADGDFDSYTVDIVSLELEQANGSVIETLPATTRIDFAQYVDLTEFVVAASIPPGTYVAGTITLDYTEADVNVEFGDDSKPATVVDDDGVPLGQTSLKIKLDDRNQLFITRGRTSLLTVDFDLEASHTVDVVPTPAIAVAEPFIVADIDPVDTKDIRVRGLLIDTNEAEMYYTVAIRPFHDRNGDFGRAKVNVTDETEFEVNGVAGKGVEGLRLLAAAGQGTLTVAQGTLNVGDREFTANIVLAGSSVPGSDSDFIKGNVISRVDNVLTIRGGTVFRRDLRPYYHRNITVAVGPETKVFKTTFDGELGIDAISVGQNVWVRGDITIDNDRVMMDATMGAVRMNVTRIAGLVNSFVPDELEMELHRVDGKRVSLFNFEGTGMGPGTDADPLHYQVQTGSLLLDNQAAGQPVVVFGFPNAFGAAPPDFIGRTVVDFADVRSSLGVGWGADGTDAAFTMIDGSGLLLNNMNEDIDQRHYIKKGSVLIDLTNLPDTLIAPRETGRKCFVIKTADSLQLYADYDDFMIALMDELGAGKLARSMFAHGTYDVANNVFTATKIGIHLLEP